MSIFKTHNEIYAVINYVFSILECVVFLDMHRLCLTDLQTYVLYVQAPCSISYLRSLL